MGSIWILGGLQLLALGVIGEYIGKIYAEVKGRPRYLVEEMLDE
jgi:glycosyltransferase involved in cell wall biosynthesis